MSFAFLDWISKRPVTPVRPKRSYITLPAFDTVTVPWRGASIIARQWNFTVGNNFTVLRKPIKPDFTSASVAFSLAIRYRRGNTVYRWKLWEDELDGISGITWPLYRGQKIFRNFCLEAWCYLPADQTGNPPVFSENHEIGTVYTLDGVWQIVVDNGFGDPVNRELDATPALGEAINILTSIQALPTYPWNMDDYAQDAGAAVSLSELQSPNLTFPISFGASSSWLDNS